MDRETTSQPPFQIQEWKPATHGTLIGFVSLQLPRGLILSGLQVHESEGRHWVEYPARATSNGTAPAPVPVVTFSSPKRKQKFENHLHQSLAAHLRRYWK